MIIVKPRYCLVAYMQRHRHLWCPPMSWQHAWPAMPTSEQSTYYKMLPCMVARYNVARLLYSKVSLIYIIHFPTVTHILLTPQSFFAIVTQCTQNIHSYMLYNAVLVFLWLKRDRQNCFLFIYVLGVVVALQFILISDKKRKENFPQI